MMKIKGLRKHGKRVCQQLAMNADLAIYKNGDQISDAGFNPPYILMSITDHGVVIGLKKATHQSALIADFNVEFCRVKTEIFKSILAKDTH